MSEFGRAGRAGRAVPVSADTLPSRKAFPYACPHTIHKRRLLPYGWVDVRIKTVLHEPPHNTRLAHACILEDNERGEKAACLHASKTASRCVPGSSGAPEQVPFRSVGAQKRVSTKIHRGSLDFKPPSRRGFAVLEGGTSGTLERPRGIL